LACISDEKELDVCMQTTEFWQSDEPIRVNCLCWWHHGIHKGYKFI